jgi:protein N-terminal methyltransferase
MSEKVEETGGMNVEGEGELISAQATERLWKGKDLPSDWYSPAVRYWSQQEKTVNGMLGGYGHISDTDIEGSRQFIRPFLDGTAAVTIGTGRAIDCGAGIGRTTQHFLSHIFDKVDLVEQSKDFVDQARVNMQGNSHMGEFFCSGLQDFTPGLLSGTAEVQKIYDCIWIQWVLLYLTDSDLIAFLQRCKAALKPNGLIFVKENVNSKSDGFVVDPDDNSLTRADEQYRALFLRAGLTLLKTSVQKKFPKELFP